MNALLADSPTVSSSEQTPPQQTTAPGSDGPPPPERACANCGSPLNPDQDWCLQCGAGTPESLTTRAPSWRSAAAILAIAAVLAVGAATAAYAALSKGGPKHRSVVTTVAQATVPATTTPTTPLTPTPTTPGATATTPTPTPTAPGTPTTVNPLLPTGGAKPPKIPLTAPTPKSSGTSPKAGTPGASEGGPSTATPKSTEGTPPANEPQPTSIVLDTNAASTYNPYNYPASSFGDPSLAIDGESNTGWTAQVEPAVAPKMAEGLAIDLKTPRRVSALTLVTSTPGMTVQVYGANGSALPTSITDPTWAQLSPYFIEKKKHVRIKLRHSAKAFRFVVLWISSAPAAAVGTPQAPGHVSVNELELFPAKA
ncbi:MAG TPA: hypothetical protein VGL68_08190 [Solirubrobacteraceae bacterium]